jgi:hypothetical protein
VDGLGLSPEEANLLKRAGVRSPADLSSWGGSAAHLSARLAEVAGS